MSPVPAIGPLPVPPAGALGLLAAGAHGLEAWRQARDGSAPFLRPCGDRAARAGRPRVLLLGWDAADRRLISPLVDAGLMPTLARLICRGSLGNLRTATPPVSPLVWTSIATGMTADRHGILGFTEPGPSGGLRPIRSTSRRVKALWNMADQEGLRSCVVGWWPSHPAEALDGVVVSNLFQVARGPVGQPWPVPAGSVHPPELAQELAALRIHPQELTAAHVLPFVPLAARVDQERNPGLSRIAGILAEAATVHAVATWLMESTDWDFTAVYLSAIDRFCHGFMRFHPPRQPHVPQEAFEIYKDVVTGAYRFHDMMLERLLELAGPDCTVVLVSDHGFHPDHLRPERAPHVPAGPVAEHREQGVILVAGPGIKQDGLIFGASVYDVAPTVLAALGLPIGRDMTGKPLLQVFEAAPATTYIDSWEQRGAALAQQAAAHGDPWADYEALRQLAGLGYVDPLGSSTPEGEVEVENERRATRLNLAHCLMSQRRHGEALPILEGLVASAPDVPRLGLFLAECCLRLGQLSRCEQVLDDVREAVRLRAAALAQGPSGVPRGVAKARAMVDLLEGELRLAQGATDTAQRAFRRALDAGSLGAQALCGMGSVHLRLREWLDALECFDRALAVDSDCAAAHDGRAVALLALGQAEPAAAAALEAVGLDFHAPMAHFHLGSALAALQDFERAAECWEICLEQAPASRPAREELIRLYERRLGRGEAAAAHRRMLEGAARDES